ncbi:phage antirepressor KilAC domain-containing protein [Escherichia coli]|uniref:phage antirepressor KilAC domain-containing protein n=1 Tax=Escherichia coli TaxID=562 RepID=UPI0009944C00|nr:phage antirepressor KilAC domain-containing protein [Escherichia coli]AQW17560.1 hypothetical protein BE937_13545 [Escherichia coli]ASO87956.1 hypothetical protein AKO63_1480 [Escherichia coli]EFA6074777.1 hypothetical protein [Escherichia coli]EIK6533953.1 phage antirepressor KilAC domain-containing protein [Escherichia coli]EKL8865244.1 phage antirepressor KilAC domain-containing protein [Escherichia coli]
MARRNHCDYVYTLKQAARLIGYHEHEFIDLLIGRGILYQACLTLYPKAKYLQEKLFIIMTDENQVNHPFVTDKGLTYLKEIL